MHAAGGSDPSSSADDAAGDDVGTGAPPPPAVRRKRRLAATIAVVAGAAFFVLAALVPAPFVVAFDESVLRVMRRIDDPASTLGGDAIAGAARDITALGGTVVLVLVVGLVATYLAVDRRFRDALAVVAASLGGVLIGLFLKVIFGRERPSVVPHLVGVDTASFPSGHSMQSAIVYATLGALLARFAKRRATQVLPIAAAVAITFLVGVSRLVLGVHYPTDVLAGWAAGAAWAAASWMVVDSLAREGTLEGRATPPA
jgi:undecaprenyl-diphosphatase